MKKKLFVATALACMLAAGTVSAQTGPEMMHGAGPGAMPPMGTDMEMGPNMMGGGMGMRPCMMGGGMGMGPGMMGGGMGMGPGMMGGGMGMGPCMMGGGMGMGPGMMGAIDPEDQQKYLDATRDLRKKMNDKQFEYAEAARNPKTSRADLLKKRKELWDIQQKIHEKAWNFIKE
ncbi:hypothetical protein [Thiovibrio frasassiensis]|jgi:hypothetical protein|uniref:Periplasmic heavy metal sensor n=1 Tax=Thiovibrio frasassiensis TaxID=2984131 RepID=A0A9X4MEX8_9BACT|nr:hypothetical protein [Thiovibrio frasassiensis]MDG4475008.1 hypothetical protein [Thiovibrio frasassiensis]